MSSLLKSLLLQQEYEEARTLMAASPKSIVTHTVSSNRGVLSFAIQNTGNLPEVTIQENENDQSYAHTQANVPNQNDDNINHNSYHTPIKRGNITKIDDDEDPTIFYALRDVETLEHLLLLSPASAWSQNRSGCRPLHAACQISDVHIDVIAILIFAFPEGASTKNIGGKFPLHFAAANISDVGIFREVYKSFPKAITEKETKNYSKPLHYACAFQAPLQIIQFLIKNHREAIEQKDRSGNLPLHLSLVYDSPEDVCIFLLDSYPNAITERDRKGRMSIHIAMQSTTITSFVLEKLLSLQPEAINDIVITPENNNNESEPNDKNISLDKPWIDSKKPIHLALRFLSHRVDIITVLLSHSGYQEVYKKCITKSLSKAVRLKNAASNGSMNGNNSIDQNQGIEDEIVDQTFYLNGDTILHTALEFGASIAVLETITTLRPSSLKEQNNDGKLPIHFAAWRQVDVDTMVFIIRQDPESLGTIHEPTGNVALHFALQYAGRGSNMNTNMIEKVLSYRASACFICNKAGFYPIHLAARAACPFNLMEALLKVAPYSYGIFSDNYLNMLPLDLAIASDANADVIGLLLGYSGKSDNVRPKRVMEDRQHPLPIENKAVPSDELYDYQQMITLMDGHLNLQQQFKDQGEEMRKLRTRMHSISSDLKDRNETIKGLNRDVGWGKDRIKILEREVAHMTAQVASYKSEKEEYIANKIDTGLK
jgi:hypothetical protein